MKLVSMMLLSVSLVSMCGCQYTDRRKASMEMNVLSVKFQTLMEQGQTTREQEQAYIKSVSSMALQLDRSVRGTSAATTTRQNAVTFAQTGIDPSAPVSIKPQVKRANR